MKSIKKNGIIINYYWTVKRIKGIYIRIHRDGMVYVSSGIRFTEKEVENFILSKFDYIYDAINRSDIRKDNSCRDATIEEGAIVSIWGQKHVIHIINSYDSYVEITSREIIIHKGKGRKSASRIYDEFRKQELQNIIGELVLYYSKKMEPMGITLPPDIIYGNYKSKWGSCNLSTNELKFSYNLFEVPLEAVEYVVVHELSHMLVGNHGKDFYDVVSKIMPDYKNRISILKDYA